MIGHKQNYKMIRNVLVHTLQKPFDVSDLKTEAPFACMIYSNQKAAIDEISSIADWLISSGCRYVVCGGNDCKIWHDVIDETSVMKEIEENKEELIMTTWHNDESIKEIVWFWLNLTNFDDITFENYLGLIIGESKEIKEKIQQSINENVL